MTDYAGFGEKVNHIFEEVTKPAKNVDLKRENANINGDAPMGAMLQYGANTAKEWNLDNLVDPYIAKLHREGWIHIHDLDFYAWTTTCCQIHLKKLLQKGFSTGHGYLRPPKSIGAYAALAAIAIQSEQSDQHGGQSIADFDYAMADGVRYSYTRHMNDAIDIETKFGHADDVEWRKEYALKKTRRDTYQAMEGLIHNLNTMQSRAGAQVE